LLIQTFLSQGVDAENADGRHLSPYLRLRLYQLDLNLQLSYIGQMENNLMRHRSPIRLDACNLATSFGLIGDRWSLLILRSALYGVRRFDDFRAELDIPRTVLSDRLKRLVANGIMMRLEYQTPGSRARPEYTLTEMGKELRLPFLAMTQWADAWLGDSRPRPLTLRRKANDSAVRIGMLDENDLGVTADDVDIHFAEWARSE
jgi:DNA-binding HxlR family transcriptional regulator